MEQNAHQSDETLTVRPLALYHPNIWGDQFLNYTPPDELTQRQREEEVKELKEEVRRKLLGNAENTKERLVLIDVVEQLGVAYHFEDEIEANLHSQDNVLYEDDLHYVALRFRLLRQHGFYASSDVFYKFKNEDGSFKELLTKDVVGMLNLYEASYLRVHEEKILDEAVEFTTTQLKSVVGELSEPLATQVTHALKLPLHKGATRLLSRYYISIYEANPLHDQMLLKFAKLDFNLLQTLYLTEPRDLTRWDKSNVNQLPDYMKLTYEILLDTFEGLEQDLAKEGRSQLVSYVQELMKAQCRGYFQEAKWCKEKHVPTYDEYMDEAAITTAGYTVFSGTTFLGMGELATKAVFEWVGQISKPIKAACIIGRLMDNIADHKDEQKREHVASAIECYMKQYDVNEEEAVREPHNVVEGEWKNLNEEMLRPTIMFPRPLMSRILDLVRATEVFYGLGDDEYSIVNQNMQHKIQLVLIQPIIV